MTDIIIDCDPGHDDAIALLLALASPEVRVLGVSTVAGNAAVDKTTANALRVLELAGRRHIPVARGAAAPLSRPHQAAEQVHGESGLDGPSPVEPAGAPVEGFAPDVLARWIERHGGPVTIVPTGPLTNIALMLAHHPWVGEQIDRIVLMGGSIGLGNVTPAAEFNIWADPDAAARVFAAGLDVTMVGLDVTHLTVLTPEHARRLRPTGVVGSFVADLLDFFIARYEQILGTPVAPIHDAAAVAHVIAPGLIGTEHLNVEIEVTSELTRGRTVVDRWRVTAREPNAHVAVSVDADAFVDLLIGRLEGLG